MTKELREIIEKLVSDNPDIEKITADWRQELCDGVIWVYMPSLHDKAKSNELSVHYTDYVNDTYGNDEPQFDEFATLVCFTDDYMEDPLYKIVYTKESGVIENAI